MSTSPRAPPSRPARSTSTTRSRTTTIGRPTSRRKSTFARTSNVGAWLIALVLLGVQPQETVAEIRVHGNVATQNDEIRRLAGIQIGAPVLPDTVAAVTDRLRAARRFDRVEVLKRFASIADPAQIVLVIIVDEGAVKIERTGDAASPVRVVKTRGPRLMFLPLVSAEDGYGLIYGARVGLPNPAGKGSRLPFPLTWGGDKGGA